MKGYQMLDPHCMTPNQRLIANFGRKMMDMAAIEKNDVLSNAFARVGEHLAERASFKGLTALDHDIIRFAKARDV
jgi:hypothetical protein